MKKILILANSSGGLYDFRNELLEKLLKEYEVVVSLPDEVRNKELRAAEAFFCHRMNIHFHSLPCLVNKES